MARWRRFVLERAPNAAISAHLLTKLDKFLRFPKERACRQPRQVVRLGSLVLPLQGSLP
jgi:hypothetical protein